MLGMNFSGGNGNHAFIQNGGTATISANVTDQVQDWFIGRAPGNSGTLNHSAGTASNLGWTFVGTDGGTGTYNLTGAGGSVGSGSFTTGRLYVGGVRDFNGGTGTATVNTTGTLTLGGDLAVGTRGGTGNFTFNSGTIVANTWMIV